MVSCDATLEAVKRVFGQVNGEYSASISRTMQRARAAELISQTLAGFKANKRQHLGHRHEEANLAKIDPGHRLTLATEKRNP